MQCETSLAHPGCTAENNALQQLAPGCQQKLTSDKKEIFNTKTWQQSNPKFDTADLEQPLQLIQHLYCSFCIFNFISHLYSGHSNYSKLKISVTLFLSKARRVSQFIILAYHTTTLHYNDVHHYHLTFRNQPPSFPFHVHLLIPNNTTKRASMI